MTTNEKVIEYMVINRCSVREAMEAVIGEGAFLALASQVWRSVNAREAVERLSKGWLVLA